jgi:hypothetical protein
VDTEQLKTDTSVYSGLGLSLIGTTCCAVPVILVGLGLGGAVASVVSVFPWLTVLSHVKGITFSMTALVLAYAYWRLRRARSCTVAGQQRLRWQRIMLWSGSVMLAMSLFAAYALLPLTRVWHGTH